MGATPGQEDERKIERPCRKESRGEKKKKGVKKIIPTFPLKEHAEKFRVARWGKGEKNEEEGDRDSGVEGRRSVVR